MEDKNGELLPQFAKVIEYKKYDNIFSGTIGKRFNFVGLPFLKMPRGGVEGVVEAVKRAVPV
jgi:hypothetical protein